MSSGLKSFISVSSVCWSNLQVMYISCWTCLLPSLSACIEKWLDSISWHNNVHNMLVQSLTSIGATLSEEGTGIPHVLKVAWKCLFPFVYLYNAVLTKHASSSPFRMTRKVPDHHPMTKPASKCFAHIASWNGISKSELALNKWLSSLSTLYVHLQQWSKSLNAKIGNWPADLSL